MVVDERLKSIEDVKIMVEVPQSGTEIRSLRPQMSAKDAPHAA